MQLGDFHYFATQISGKSKISIVYKKSQVLQQILSMIGRIFQQKKRIFSIQRKHSDFNVFTIMTQLFLCCIFLCLHFSHQTYLSLYIHDTYSLFIKVMLEFLSLTMQCFRAFMMTFSLLFSFQWCSLQYTRCLTLSFYFLMGKFY